MLAQLKSSTVLGFDAYIVEIEIDTSRNHPSLYEAIQYRSLDRRRG